MFEADELRVHYELELAELKRSNHLQSQEDKRIFNPGESPKELSSLNADLIHQINQMKEEFE